MCSPPHASVQGRSCFCFCFRLGFASITLTIKSRRRRPCNKQIGKNPNLFPFFSFFPFGPEFCARARRLASTTTLRPRSVLVSRSRCPPEKEEQHHYRSAGRAIVKIESNFVSIVSLTLLKVAFPPGSTAQLFDPCLRPCRPPSPPSPPPLLAGHNTTTPVPAQLHA